MSSLAILIPIVVVAWIAGLALIVALCVTSARSDRATRIAVRQASSDRELLGSGRTRSLFF
jgi:archaellin